MGTSYVTRYPLRDQLCFALLNTSLLFTQVDSVAMFLQVESNIGKCVQSN